MAMPGAAVREQLEFPLDELIVRAAARPVAIVRPAARVPAVAAAPQSIAVLDPPIADPTPAIAFGRWLIAPAARGGAIDELAAAARIDPGFPRQGSPAQVRARLQTLGADCDAFEQLAEAERRWRDG
jgi:hypothetical protein